MEFHTFEDVLDFAILQEKAAQEFYSDLHEKAVHEDVRRHVELRLKASGHC